MESPAGVLLGRVSKLMYDMGRGFGVRLSDVNALEYLSMRVIDAERERFKAQQ